MDGGGEDGRGVRKGPTPDPHFEGRTPLVVQLKEDLEGSRLLLCYRSASTGRILPASPLQH